MTKNKPTTIRLSPEAEAKLQAIIDAMPWLNRSSAIEMLLRVVDVVTLVEYADKPSH